MTTAKRTGDDDSRIVHGGELPEDDGSLDDVVVDPPQEINPNSSGPRKNPDELWTTYFVRRLADEGIYLGEFKNDQQGIQGVDYSNITHRINSNLLLQISRFFDWGKLSALTCSKREYSSFNLSQIIDYERITICSSAFNSFDKALHLLFYHSKETAKADFFGEVHPKFKQLPFIRNYEDGKIYPAEQVIIDLVNYIKETGIKR